MLSNISIGTLSSSFHHFCEKMASVFHEYIYMPAGDDLAAGTSTFAIFAISAISGVLKGLRITRIRLFAKFARLRTIVSVLTSIVRLLECGNKDGGDMTRAEMLACIAVKEVAYIRGRRSQRRPGITSHCLLTSCVQTEQRMEFVEKFSLNILRPTPKFLSGAIAGSLITKKQIKTRVVKLQFFLILISKSFAGQIIFPSKELHSQPFKQLVLFYC